MFFRLAAAMRALAERLPTFSPCEQVT